MELTVSFENQPADVKHSFLVRNEIDGGKLSVYKVYSPTKKSHFALKVFPKNYCGRTQFKKEKNLLKLNHPNIIRSIPSACDSPRFTGILTEYADGGDFFELVTKNIFNTEVLIRTYFHQLIEGIEYVHSQGIAHLDLKLENIMLSANYTLKLIDFDQAQSLKDDALTSGGTEGYRAPEVLSGKCKNFAAADIYSIGIILYAMKVKKFPFTEKKTRGGVELVNYEAFLHENESFWTKKAEAYGDRSVFSEDFIALVNGMLWYRPEERFTIKDIKNSKWYKGPILDMKARKEQMAERFARQGHNN